MEKWIPCWKPHLLISMSRLRPTNKTPPALLNPSNLSETQICNGLTLQWSYYCLMLEIKSVGFNQLRTGKTPVLSQDSLPPHTQKSSTQGTFSGAEVTFFFLFLTLSETEYVCRVSSLWDFIISLRDSIWLLSGGQEQGSRESQWCNYKPFCPPSGRFPGESFTCAICQIEIKGRV